MTPRSLNFRDPLPLPLAVLEPRRGRRASTIVAFIVASCALAWPAAAQPLSRSGASAHDHSTAAKGGTTLAPTTLSMLPSSTATLSGYVPGFWVEVASAAVTAKTSYTFSNLVSSTSYRLSFNTTQNTLAGGHYIQFNGDSGANYGYVVTGIYANTLGGNADGGAAKTGCGMTDLVTEIPKAGTAVKGTFEFETQPGLPANRTGNSVASWTENSVSYFTTDRGGCWHVGSGQLTSIAYLTSAGTMTGNLTLERYHRK